MISRNFWWSKNCNFLILADWQFEYLLPIWLNTTLLYDGWCYSISQQRGVFWPISRKNGQYSMRNIDVSFLSYFIEFIAINVKPEKLASLNCHQFGSSVQTIGNNFFLKKNPTYWHLKCAQSKRNLVRILQSCRASTNLVIL